MYNARVNNAGWRIDYFIVSNKLKEKIKSAPIYSDVFGSDKEKIKSAPIYSDVFGSDHCPIGLEIDI